MPTGKNTRRCAICGKPFEDDSTLVIWRETYVHMKCAFEAQNWDAAAELANRLWQRDRT